MSIPRHYQLFIHNEVHTYMSQFDVRQIKARQMDLQMIRTIDGQIDRWIDEYIDGQIDILID